MCIICKLLYIIYFRYNSTFSDELLRTLFRNMIKYSVIYNGMIKYHYWKCIIVQDTKFEILMSSLYYSYVIASNLF